jgi:hypothetical protein
LGGSAGSRSLRDLSVGRDWAATRGANIQLIYATWLSVEEHAYHSNGWQGTKNPCPQPCDGTLGNLRWANRKEVFGKASLTSETHGLSRTQRHPTHRFQTHARPAIGTAAHSSTYTNLMVQIRHGNRPDHMAAPQKNSRNGLIVVNRRCYTQPILPYPRQEHKIDLGNTRLIIEEPHPSVE